MADNYVRADIALPITGYVAKFTPTSSVDEYVRGIVSSPTESLYVKAEVYFKAAAVSTILSQTDAWSMISIGDTNNPDDAWQHLYIDTNGTDAFFLDDQHNNTFKINISPDTWHTVELGIRLNGGNYEATFKVDGTERNWVIEGSIAPSTVWDYFFIGATNISTGIIPNVTFYVDNVEVSKTNWPSSGGAIAFSDDFNDGTFNAWDSTVATPSTVPNINETTAPDEIYVSADIYIPAANYSAMVSNGGAFKHYILGIAQESGTLPDDIANGWGIWRDSTTLYLNDYYEFYTSTSRPITADTWHTVELAIKPGVGNDWQTNTKVDGVMGSWTGFNGSPAGHWGQIIAGSFWADSANDYVLIDNVKVAADNWVSSGGTVIFQDDFETQNLSQWDATIGTPTVIAKP